MPRLITTSADVSTVLALFEEQAPGQFWRYGRFMELTAIAHLQHAQRGEGSALLSALNRVNGDHATLLTIVERNEWQKQMARRSELDHNAWFYFAGLDVEHYFVALRSTFDSIAGVLRLASPSAGQLSESFSGLRALCRNNPDKARRKLGAEAVSLIADADWFDPVRITRDGIVHLGALSIAFPTHETVSFAVHVEGQRVRMPPALMTNENIADFELYMAWTLGNVELILERIGELLLPRYSGPNAFGTRSFRTGFSTIAGYLMRLRARLETYNAASVSAVNGRGDR